MANLVLEMTGSKSKLVHLPLPADDPTQRKPDITLARERLGWEPRIPLKAGLASTIDWFRSIDLRLYPPPTPNF